MKISDGLKEKIEEVFKGKEEIKNKLLSGDADTIREIGKISQGGIKPEEIVEAYENNKTEDLYKKAKLLTDLKNIYLELCNSCFYQKDSRQGER